jgi:uncharacterized protein YbcC (UPF0753/DUF2309 family)
MIAAAEVSRAPMAQTALSDTIVLEALELACSRIAPTWPLDRFIAVNPFWRWVDRPVHEVAAELGALSGARLTMPRTWYRSQLEAGAFSPEHLAQAIAELNSTLSTQEVIDALERGDRDLPPPPRAQVVDVVEHERDDRQQASWRPFLRDRISACCAARFDRGQSAVGGTAGRSLYEAWWHDAQQDRSPSLLMGLGGFRRAVAELPRDPFALVQLALTELGVAEEELGAYLTSLLLDVNGWASWCAYLRWCRGLEGEEVVLSTTSLDPLAELAAVRLAWELLLYRTADRRVHARWPLAMASWAEVAPEVERVLGPESIAQRALELAHHEQVAKRVRDGLTAPRPDVPRVQAAFCIDVRSEVFRRALEASSPDVQTLGFAGFFGLPAGWRDPLSGALQPQLPGLLAPQVVVSDTGLSSSDVSRQRSWLEVKGAVEALRASAMSAFHYVESFGLFYGAAAAAKTLSQHTDEHGHHTHRITRPRLIERVDGGELTLEAQTTSRRASCGG